MPLFGPDITLDNPAFIHETALLYGKITIGDGSSVWPNVVMRAEVNEIRIGSTTNIQDFTMIHIGYMVPTVIGNNCSITHHCTIHGCTIGDNVLIGIGATVMDGVEIGDNSIVAGGAFVKEGTIIPPNSIAMGVPAKTVKSRNCYRENRLNALYYRQNAIAFSAGEFRVWSKENLGVEFQRQAAEEYEALFGNDAS